MSGVPLERHQRGQALLGEHGFSVVLAVWAPQLCIGDYRASVERGDRPIRAERKSGTRPPQVARPECPLRADLAQALGPVVAVISLGVEGAVGRLHTRGDVLGWEPVQ